MRISRPFPYALIVTLLLGVLATAVLALPESVRALPGAQGSPLASQTLGRGYTHMFVAYAVAWLLVLGWVISIGRRLGRAKCEPGEE